MTMLQKCPQKLPLLTQGSTTPWATLLASQFVSQLNLFSVHQTMVEVNYCRSFLVTITSRLILQHFSLKFCQPFVVNLSTSRGMQTGFTNAILGLGYLGTSPFLFLPPPKQRTLQLEALLLFAQNIPELALQGFESPCSQDSIPGPEISVKCQNGYKDCCLRNAYF